MEPVVLVNMPFANLRWPNISLGLLAGGLLQQGISCRVLYLNFDFAERIGFDLYQWIADCFAFVLGGEWLFAQWLFADQLPHNHLFYQEVLQQYDPEFSQEDWQLFRGVVDQVEPFLRQCLQQIDWSKCRIVGFTTSFQQTLPSLCLAKLLKQHFPDIVTVFGGAACQGEMGVELLRQFPQIDHVCLGEGDIVFPRLVESLLAGNKPPLLPGIVSREQLQFVPDSKPAQQPALLPTLSGGLLCGNSFDLQSLLDPHNCLVTDLDSLPCPHFDDYFRRLQRSQFASQLDPLLFVETSRGCWWGQKHQCKFCGLNGPALVYRSKSPARVLEEFRLLLQRYGVRRFCTSDNVLDPRYIDTLLPQLEQARLRISFEYELKCNLSRKQVDRLVSAGLGAAQLGIETFSTKLLRTISKGTTGLQNIQVLKWFSEHGIEVKWNFLYGFPGEDPREYSQLKELIPLLVHLAPPSAVGQVRADRFSPYFENPSEHGIASLRPHRAFRYVYPFQESVLRRLAYYFEFEHADGRDVWSYVFPVVQLLNDWQQFAGMVSLRYFDRDDGVLIITDTRPCARAFQHRLVDWQRHLYLFCDTGRTMSQIIEQLENLYGQNRPPVDEIKRQLSEWCEQKIMLYWDDHYLSLAICPRTSECGSCHDSSRTI